MEKQDESGERPAILDRPTEKLSLPFRLRLQKSKQDECEEEADQGKPGYNHQETKVTHVMNPPAQSVMHDRIDRPGVLIFPPLLMALALLAMIALHWLWPLPLPIGLVSRVLLGVVMAVAGIGTAAWGRTTMVKAGTNVSPLKRATAIVSSGPFRFTRNPLYVGAMTLLLGISLVIGTWWGFVVLVPLLVTLHFGVIRREERYLEREFGESYLRYKHSVRRYL